MTFSNNLTCMHTIKCFSMRSTKLWPRQNSRRFSSVHIVILVPNFVPNSPNTYRVVQKYDPLRDSPADTQACSIAFEMHVVHYSNQQLPVRHHLQMIRFFATWRPLDTGAVWANEELLTKVPHHCVLCHQQATSPRASVNICAACTPGMGSSHLWH